MIRMQQNRERHKTYYAIVEVEGRRLGTYVQAKTVAAVFEAAMYRYKKRYPLLHAEPIAVRETHFLFEKRPKEISKKSKEEL